ncbi:Large proline-rich protein BAG6 [Portunus trituberculatus]|uniref:Large proline-rich protein BAG6 n=1 Tax=Portunus trituberculatus TaxID=210409 RepID=A0A5B7ED88_PORTR|nr:Large proline-rich protein BAG6 [Portunus trituberculatus]
MYEAKEGTGGSSSEGGAGMMRLEHPRCAVMVEVLDQYTQIQRRLEPYLARYYQAMANDPVFSDGEADSLQQQQWLLWRVSEVLHFVSHAMHAISDIMVDLRRAPPRQLRARPIIIQQPALVQAQINVTTSSDPSRGGMSVFSSSRPSTTTTSQSSSANQSSSTTASSQTTTTTTTNVSSSTTSSSSSSSSSSSTSTSSMSTNTSADPSSNYLLVSGPVTGVLSATTTTPASSTPSTTSTTTPSATPHPARNLASLLNLGSMQGFPMDGGDLVLMEVGPHGITIDSVSAEGGSTGGSAPPPELIQNLVSSITSQLGMHIGGATPSTTAPASTTSAAASSASVSSSATTANTGVPSAGPGRNSQAAGNRPKMAAAQPRAGGEQQVPRWVTLGEHQHPFRGCLY